MSHHAHPYGVGLAWRHVIHEHCRDYHDEVDLLEIPTEDYLVRERRLGSDPDEALLQDALDTFPCVAHGLSLSLGSVEPLRDPVLLGTQNFLARTGIHTFSEHLAFHRMDGNDLTLFLSLPFEEVAVQWVAENYRAVRAILGRPFALENVTYDFPVPNPSLDDADFLRRITEETDCTLLVDVTNVFNNAHNHGFNAIDFIHRLPLERISQLHLAGGHFTNGKWEDSHSAPVMEPVWKLFDEIVRHAPNANIVILERDSKFDPFDTVLTDLRRAREIFYAHRTAKHATSAPAAGAPYPFTMPALESVARPDPLDPAFAQLRGYERALMKRITDPTFRDSYAAAPDAALAGFGLDPAWTDRLHLTDPKAVTRYADNWDAIDREDREIHSQYVKNEWAAWAAELSS